MKYKKIVEASRQSVDAMKDEVRKTYFEIDRQLKPKIKCLTNELKMHDIEGKIRILILKVFIKDIVINKCGFFRASIDTALHESATVPTKNGKKSEGTRGETRNDT